MISVYLWEKAWRVSRRSCSVLRTRSPLWEGSMTADLTLSDVAVAVVAAGADVESEGVSESVDVVDTA